MSAPKLIFSVISALILTTSSISAQMPGSAETVKLERILNYDDSGAKRTAIDEGVLAVGGHMPLQAHPEERLYYFTDGRGIMSIYEEAPGGDVYEIRQDVSIYMTPGIKHEIINIGNTPLRFAVFLVRGGIGPGDGEGLSWGAVTQRGVTVEKPVVGAGVAVTKVFDEGSNPSEPEGMHLLIRDIYLRRPQKFSNAEVLTVAPGRSTRLHNHSDSSETAYILYGEGNFVWDDKVIPFKAGDTISYPIGVLRRVENTGKFPMSYMVMSAFVD
ncbi:MAG: cupin domain-containing protein [Candidatus Latescibacteria bacterium]|jgi:mannose-6-phosphate isomerase-like protein (cupin superfamily)|nr:cupin domain-containing protein [Candidatus Latescibacterota bacterium]